MRLIVRDITTMASKGCIQKWTKQPAKPVVVAPLTGEVYTDAAMKVAANPGKEHKNITFAYLATDPVSVVAGGNPGVISLSEFWKVLTTSNSAHSCYDTGAAECAQVEILTPSAPKDANQNNSNLIRYEGGKRVDNSPIAR